MDSIVPENSHVYRIHDGLCEIDDDYEGQCDFDIDIEVLTSIIFGNDVTRRLLDFPATRPSHKPLCLGLKTDCYDT